MILTETSIDNYEISNLCWKSNIRVVGGTSKLFEYFKRNYSHNTVKTTLDLSKYNGNAFSLIGFEIEYITEPDYIWYNIQLNEIIQKENIEKQKLIELGLGTEDSTVEEILESIGYTRIYDCGSMVMSYRPKIWHGII